MLITQGAAGATGGDVAIPPTGGPYATLPVGRHTATFDEVHETFVEQAPFRDERQLIYDALRLYTRVLAQEFTDLALWINGGFVTHKTWAAPKDTDVAVVVPLTEYSNMLSKPMLFSYLTLHNADVPINPTTTMKVARIQPMAGLIDGFIIGDEPSQKGVWDYNWSLVTDENGVLLPDTVRKGYLEVKP
jgi:hypothetical protein